MKSSILRALVDFGISKGRGVRIKRILVGDYAFVELEDGRSGLAWVYREWLNRFRKFREFPTTADEASRLILSHDPAEISVGVAAVNALAEKTNALEGDVLDLLNIPDGSRVALIGYFYPFVERLKRRGVELYVFELKPIDEDYVYPWYAEEDLLPRMDYVIATGITIVNKTIDRIAELSKNSTLVVVGPTTPLVEEAFNGKARMIAGIQVINNDAVYDMLAKGYSAWQFIHSPYVKKVVKVLR